MTRFDDENLNAPHTLRELGIEPETAGPDISTAAVQAHAKRLRDHGHSGTHGILPVTLALLADRDRLAAEVARLRAELDAAMAAEREYCRKNHALTDERDAAMAGRVKVKPLAWICLSSKFDGGREHFGTGVFGHWYGVKREKNRSWRVAHHIGNSVVEVGHFESLDAAQAAAQADYEARILAAQQPDTERAEPVAWRLRAAFLQDRFTDCRALMEGMEKDGYTVTPLYAAPQSALAPQAREITVQEAAEVPEVKALIEAAKSAIACYAYQSMPGSDVHPMAKAGIDRLDAALRALAAMQEPRE